MSKTLEVRAYMGGSFDPFHMGHLLCARQMRAMLEVKTLWLLPAQHNQKQPILSNEARLSLLNQALQSEPTLEIDDRELKRDSPAFSVDTLEELHAEHSDKSLIFIMGFDAFMAIDTWKSWQKLTRFAHLVVVARKGYPFHQRDALSAKIRQWQAPLVCDDLQLLKQKRCGSIIYLDLALPAISSTQIRHIIRRYLTADEGHQTALKTQLQSYLPKPVWQNIISNRYYSK